MSIKHTNETVKKARNWAFIMYPDSVPENWREILIGFHTDMLISPLHDKDVNPDGELKKAHWHVVVKFVGGGVRQTQVQAIADAVNASRVKPVTSLRAYARYLCHLDNPEKAQYDPTAVEVLGDVDFCELIASAADVDSVITEMEQWIDETGSYSYAALARYARSNRPDWTRVLRTRCTVHMKAYVQSCQWERREEQRFWHESGNDSLYGV